MPDEQAQGQNAPESEATQGPAQEQQQSQTTDPNAEQRGRYTDKDVDKLKGQARREARDRTQRELLEQFGVESFDDLNAIVTAHKEFEESVATEADKERKAREKAQKSLETLKAERQSVTEERDALQEKVGRYEEALNSYVEAELDGVPDHIRELLDGRDPVDQLAYLTKNREAVKNGSQGVKVNRNVGRASNVGAGANGSENLRGADRLGAYFGQKYG
jgi:chromosome segregation ATPase